MQDVGGGLYSLFALGELYLSRFLTVTVIEGGSCHFMCALLRGSTLLYTGARRGPLEIILRKMKMYQPTPAVSSLPLSPYNK